MDFTILEKSINYIFKDKKLLEQALTHTSYANTKNVQSNEKLEFFGDSILEYISSEYIYNNYIKLKEGEMTKVRATVVCEESLYEVALKHNFIDFLLLGKSEKHNKTTKLKAILADSVEAVIAAMCIDGGIDASKIYNRKLKRFNRASNTTCWSKRLQNSITRKITRTWKCKNCI